MNIKARAHSDDYVVEVTFDASLWFEQASDTEIRELAEIGWQNDYPADEVAIFSKDTSESLVRMFDHIENMSGTSNETGFECHVDIDSAMVWLEEHRPELAKEFRENKDIET